MPNLRNLIGLPLLSVDCGRELGKIEEIVIDSPMAAIKAMLITKPDFSHDGQDILETETQILYGVIFHNLLSIGANAVTVRYEETLTDLAPFCRTQRFHYSSRLFDKPIYTDTGFSLGILADVVFDSPTGEVTTYQISDGIFFDILYGRRLMPAPKEQIIGKGALIVPDAMEKLIYYADEVRGVF